MLLLSLFFLFDVLCDAMAMAIAIAIVDVTDDIVVCAMATCDVARLFEELCLLLLFLCSVGSEWCQHLRMVRRKTEYGR